MSAERVGCSVRKVLLVWMQWGTLTSSALAHPGTGLFLCRRLQSCFIGLQASLSRPGHARRVWSTGRLFSLRKHLPRGGCTLGALPLHCIVFLSDLYCIFAR